MGRNRFFAFLVTYVIIAVVFAVGFVINLTSSNAVSLDKAVTYQLGNDSENTSTIMLSDIYKNSKIYINMDDIARLCNMATTGDINELRFISLDDESENVSFVLSTRIAFVNGEEIRLTSDTIAKNDIVYVPIEFFNEYVEGITVNYDEDESTLKILKDVVETKTILNTDGSETTEEIYAPLKFKLKAQKPSESINEALIPQKVKK